MQIEEAVIRKKRHVQKGIAELWSKGWIVLKRDE